MFDSHKIHFFFYWKTDFISLRYFHKRCSDDGMLCQSPAFINRQCAKRSIFIRKQLSTILRKLCKWNWGIWLDNGVEWQNIVYVENLYIFHRNGTWVRQIQNGTIFAAGKILLELDLDKTGLPKIRKHNIVGTVSNVNKSKLSYISKTYPKLYTGWCRPRALHNCLFLYARQS